MKITSILLLSLVLASCLGNHVIKKKRSFDLTCNRDFQVAFSEDIQIINGDTTQKIALKVKSPRLNQKYDLHQVRSASGAKYATKDGKYIFWEHQGEFTFGTEDSTYCLCE